MKKRLQVNTTTLGLTKEQVAMCSENAILDAEFASDVSLAEVETPPSSDSEAEWTSGNEEDPPATKK